MENRKEPQLVEEVKDSKEIEIIIDGKELFNRLNRQLTIDDKD